MKSLKDHILEGILDIEDNINYDISKDVIKEFLKENYKIHGSYTIKETKNGFIVDVKGDIEVINENITTLTNGFFEFGLVSDLFSCSECNSLTSLKGSPEKVGYFNCQGCNLLTSLEGCPKEVGVNFLCSYCNSLKSLKGAPEKVGGFFWCNGCKSLKSLEGAPKEVKGNFRCSDCGTKFKTEYIKKYTNIKGRILV